MYAVGMMQKTKAATEGIRQLAAAETQAQRKTAQAAATLVEAQRELFAATQARNGRRTSHPLGSCPAGRSGGRRQ